jgi:hypothetical protein
MSFPIDKLVWSGLVCCCVSHGCAVLSMVSEAPAVHASQQAPKCRCEKSPLGAGGPPAGVAKRLAMRLDRVASFNTVSEHTTLFEDLHDKAAHLAGITLAQKNACLRLHCLNAE